MSAIWHQYAEDAATGRIVVGKFARQACERHLRDMEHGHERGLHFNEDDAAHVIEFFSKFLKHTKGEWAGKPFITEPWQQFILASLFGWKLADGLRRFRMGYQEVARKNGKTALGAGIGLYGLLPDGEPGAEVYSAATKKDQARLVHEQAISMVRLNPDLRNHIGIRVGNLHHLSSGSKFEPLGRDADSLDGLNVHMALCDELHAWKTRELWDVLDTATGSRRQSLILAITTAGFNRQSICFEQHDYTEKVLSQVIEDDSFFGIIYTIDEGDNWEDEAVWAKANPNLRVSVKIEDLRLKALRAKEAPAKLNSFLRLHLNVWTQAETRWLDADAWRACDGLVDSGELAARPCYGGLDLASNRDVTAWVLVFPPLVDGQPYRVLPRFFIPKDNIEQRVRRDRVPYDDWVRDGFMTATPGNVIDYAHILHQIDQDAQTFDLQEAAFDRWGATQIVQQLSDMGLEVVQFGQGFVSMAAPTKELERMVLGKEIAHGGNPVLAWMADNVVVRQDPAGNMKPDKDKSTEKIDGIVALIMAVGRALVAEDHTPPKAGIVFL